MMGVNYAEIITRPDPDERAARLRRQWAAPRPLPCIGQDETASRQGRPHVGEMSMAVILHQLYELRAADPGLTLTDAAKTVSAETGVNHKTIIKWAWKARQ